MKENKDQKLNFIKDNIIYVHGNFDLSISIDVLPELDKLITQTLKEKDSKIIFDIDSHGGFAHILKNLLARIEYCKKNNIIVETRTFGIAYSCGSLLACAGTKEHRYIAEYSQHCCHLGSSGLRATNDKILEREYKNSKAHFDFVRDLYKKYAKIPNLKEVINDDSLFVRGQQIIDWELADKFYY